MFGVTFMVLAPESDQVAQVTTSGQKNEVEKYLSYVKSRTELERMSDRKVTGVFHWFLCYKSFYPRSYSYLDR
jgi:leucyl-tRNA synthetase